MHIEAIVLIVMIGTFLACNFLAKLPVSLSMVLGAIAGAVVAGEGIPLRHLFEGTFVYLDTVLIIATAMIFMTVVQKAGTLSALTEVIVTRFHKVPAVMLILLMIIVMFPGMVTGSSTASVLSAGAIVAPILLMMGLPASSAGAFLAIGAVLGMAAPPVNIPAMLITGGCDMPYIGFEGPLFTLTIGSGIIAALLLGLRSSKNMDYAAIEKELDHETGRKYGLKIYLPLVVLIALMLATRLFPNTVPTLGMPLIFIISSAVGCIVGNRFPIISTISESIRTTVPVLGKLMGVGMFIQIMTLTGVRGFIVGCCIGLPTVLLYAAICTVMPAFGAVSSYGSASVLGVPFMLALLSTGNQTVIAASLAFIVCMGDLMPPTALAGNYAAQIVKEPYSKVLPKCLLPVAVCILLGLLFLLKSASLSFLVP